MDDLVLERPRYDTPSEIWVKMVEDQPHSYMLYVYKNDDIVDVKFGGTNKLTSWFIARRVLRFHRRLNKKTEWIIS